MRFEITIDGATNEQLQRAGDAAVRVLRSEGISPRQLAAAQRVAADWDEGVFTTHEVADDTEEVLAGAARAEAAAVKACGADRPASDALAAAKLRAVAEELADEDLFEKVEFEILDKLCMQGFFDDGRPEDAVALLLDDRARDQLSDAQQWLYVRRLLPLIRVQYFYPERFEAEYRRLRAEWSREDGAGNVQSLQPH